MLAAARGLGAAPSASCERGDWTGWEPVQFLGRELAGQHDRDRRSRAHRLTRRRAAPGFRGTRSSTPRVMRGSSSRASVIVHRSLDDLLAEADVVTLHLPLDPDTRHLIDAGAARPLQAGRDPRQHRPRRPGRHRSALIAALRSGRLGGAALDVYENEPEVPAELVAMENVVLATPHRLGHRDGPGRHGPARCGQRDRGARGRRADHARRLISARCETTVRTSRRKNFRFGKSAPGDPLEIAVCHAAPCRLSGELPPTRGTEAGGQEAAGIPAAVRGLLLPPEHALCARPGGWLSHVPARPSGRPQAPAAALVRLQAGTCARRRSPFSRISPERRQICDPSHR